MAEATGAAIPVFRTRVLAIDCWPDSGAMGSRSSLYPRGETMSFREEFVASPATFMHKNIVMPQFFDGRSAETGAPKESRPIGSTIKARDGKRCSKSGGCVYHFSRVLTGLSTAQKLPIYWLAYKDNTFTLGTLSKVDKYMFT